MSFFPKDSIDYSSKVNNHLQVFINNHFSHPSSQDFSPNIDFSHMNVSKFKKAGPIYSMHRYWTKQPIDVISHFISSLCPPDGLVLDPFCGTGTTGTAALFTGRKVILSDLSPIATFIAKNYTDITDLSLVNQAVKQLHQNIKPLLDKYYSTTCPKCNSSASIKDWIYSENYKCPDCSSTIPFIQPTADWSAIISKKHNKTVICPHCQSEFTKNSLQTIDPQPLGLRYSCKACKVRKSFKLLSQADLNCIHNSQLFDNQDSFLKIPLPIGVSTNQPINKNITFVNQFYTPVTFFILTTIWNSINSFPLASRSKLQFIFSSIIFRVTKLYRLRVKGQGGILSGTLYIPPLFQDINVWDVFVERHRKISRGWKELNKKLPNHYIHRKVISTHSATKLPLPDNSIDYVYTDPPYGGNINYSELNFIWECWFNYFTDNTHEVIINEIGQHKDLDAYERLFTLSLNEIYRVLKPGCWCSLVFNSSSSKIWSSIQKIVYNSPFLLSKDIISLGSNMITAKQTQSLKTARRYFVLNLYKPAPDRSITQFNFVEKNLRLSDGIISYIVSEITSYILKTPNKTARYDEIYDHVISRLLQSYSFEEFDLDSILFTHFNNLGNNLWSFKTTME